MVERRAPFALSFLGLRRTAYWNITRFALMKSEVGCPAKAVRCQARKCHLTQGSDIATTLTLQREALFGPELTVLLTTRWPTVPIP